MRLPPYLQKGDLIDFVAPSFGVTTEPYATRMSTSLKVFSKLGFATHVFPNVYKNEGVIGSNTPESRGKEINEAFASSSKAIISVGGGETMVEILPFVDFKAIREGDPKFFMGYSDNTNLTFLLPILCDMVSIYGPHAPSFYSYPLRYAEKDALAMLRGEKNFQGYPKYSISRSNPDHPLYRYRLTQPKIIEAFNYDGPVTGTMLGGCLDCLVTLCGTRFDKVKEFCAKKENGIIWFLEACDLNSVSTRRALFQLKEAGWFVNAKAFLIGRPLQSGEYFDLMPKQSYLDILGDFGLPILYNVDIGHVPPSMPIIVGDEATLSFKEGNVFISYF